MDPDSRVNLEGAAKDAAKVAAADKEAHVRNAIVAMHKDVERFEAEASAAKKRLDAAREKVAKAEAGDWSVIPEYKPNAHPQGMADRVSVAMKTMYMTTPSCGYGSWSSGL